MKNRCICCTATALQRLHPEEDRTNPSDVFFSDISLSLHNFRDLTYYIMNICIIYIWHIYGIICWHSIFWHSDISDILAFCTITGILSDLRSGLASRRTKEEEREQFNAWKIIMLNRQIINKWVIFYGYVEICWNTWQTIYRSSPDRWGTKKRIKSSLS